VTRHTAKDRKTVYDGVGLVEPTQTSKTLGVPVLRFFGDQALRADFSFVPAGKGIQAGRHGAIAGYNYELLGH